MLGEGWEDQRNRMLRSHQWFIDCATGTAGFDSAWNRDALFHFFQDAYHLKDWIKNDPSVPSSVQIEVETAVTKSPLSVCADICNASKHLKLTTAKTGDLMTEVASQSVTVHMGSHSEHSWTVESGGSVWDAQDLANQVVDAWETWLRDKGLL
jgi:hypothetical protein